VGASLLIIDPIARFADIRDVKDYSEVYKKIGPLLDLARNAECHIMMLTHNTKPLMGTANNVEDINFDAIMGSAAWQGVVDTMMVMKRDNITNQRTLASRQREGEDMPPTYLLMDYETHVIYAEGTTEEVQITRMGERVVAYLQSMGGSATEPAIREAIGGNQTRTAQGIRKLLNDETIIREGAGTRGRAYTYHLKDYRKEPPSVDELTKEWREGQDDPMFRGQY
jgi:hypothetical protein